MVKAKVSGAKHFSATTDLWTSCNNLSYTVRFIDDDRQLQSLCLHTSQCTLPKIWANAPFVSPPKCYPTRASPSGSVVYCHNSWTPSQYVNRFAKIWHVASDSQCIYGWTLVLDQVIKSRNQYFCRYGRINLNYTFYQTCSFQN